MTTIMYVSAILAGQNSTGNFLNNVVKAVAPALGVIDQLPIADTLKKLKGDDKK